MNYENDESPLITKPEIILIRPVETNSAQYKTGKFWENLGILSIASYLESLKIKLGIIEANLFRCSHNKICNLVTKYSSRFVGVGVFANFMLDECIQILDLIKKELPDVITILGGVGANFIYSDILDNNPSVDVIIRGEGEKSLFELLKAKNISQWKTIPNLAYRFKNKILVNAMSPCVKNLDSLPEPNRFARHIMESDPVLSKAPPMLLSTRGCFNRCRFCSIGAYYNGNFRVRTPNNFVNEIERLVSQFNFRVLHFYDSTFVGPGKAGRQHALDIANEIIRRDLRIAFHITTQSRNLDDELVRTLHKAGLRSVLLGIESADQNTLDYFHKNHSPEDTKRAVDLFWNNGIYRMLLGFIFFHPLMNLSEFRANLDYLDSLPTGIPSRFATRLQYLPGSDLWNESKHLFGKDAYKNVIDCPLPGKPFDILYEICEWFNRCTLSIGVIIETLEDRYLYDDELMKYLAGLRKRISTEQSNKLRVIVDLLEADDVDYKTLTTLGRDILDKTLASIIMMKKDIGGPFLDYVLNVYHLNNGDHPNIRPLRNFID